MEMKICTRCCISKKVSEFKRTTKNKTGITPRCKDCINECHREYVKERRAKDPGFRKKVNEYANRWRGKNPEAVKLWTKEYRSRPDIKEKHRKEVSEWRKNNPEKQIDISKRSYAKNGVKANERKRTKLKSDPAYAEKVRERGRKYTESGRRKIVARENYRKNRERIRESVKRRRIENPDKDKAYQRDYRKRYWSQVEKGVRENLSDRYVSMLIRKQLHFAITPSDVPKNLIHVKRANVSLKRELKHIKS